MNAARGRGAALAPLLLAPALLAATPADAHLVGGEVETRTAADPGVEVGRVAGRKWIAWKVPSGNQVVGCFSHWTRRGVEGCGCDLAQSQRSWGSSDSWTGHGSPGGQLEIYAAVENGRVEDLLLVSESCPVQARGERVVALDGVDPAKGVAWLERLARATASSKAKTDVELAERALAAIAHHSAKDVPAAPLAIAGIARDDRDPDQRSHALFWLSQTDEPRAARWIREAIVRDPDDEVREQAVFALSQLPDATDQLLAVIRESRDRKIQRQALFWLGQSGDPRALAEIERVLLR